MFSQIEVLAYTKLVELGLNPESLNIHNINQSHGIQLNELPSIFEGALTGALIGVVFAIAPAFLSEEWKILKSGATLGAIFGITVSSFTALAD